MDTDDHQTCGECGASNSIDSRFCSQCGKPLGANPPDSAELAERKQVTVLFSDLTGFTALTEKLDPEDTRQIISSIFETAAQIVTRYEGRIEKFVGDAIMAIFGVPVAHEDDPHRAVRAALELHAAVAQMSPAIEARTGIALDMHSGVNTGVVVTGELQIDHGTAGPLGDTINTAARLMNGAPSGDIWIGPATMQLVASAFELEDLGLHEFKGKANAMSVARVVAASEGSIESKSRNVRGDFVGRQAELGALLGAAEKMRDGQAQVLGVCGDAGTGKTRLVSEFRAQLGGEVQWLEGRAHPYVQDTPFALFIDLLNRAWQIDESDGPDRVREKIVSGVRGVLGADDDAITLYFHLYNLEQAQGVVVEREAFRDRLLAVTNQVLATLAARAPTVLCLQDLHWADPSSSSLLGELAASLEAPILLLCNYRPGYAAPPGMHEISLADLSARQTGELLTSLLQGEAPEALVGFVAERSDGNPFFVEEVVNSLIETGVLVKQDDKWTLVRPLEQAGLPATIRGIIAARIDRLDESRRILLRHAAVVGRAFLVNIVSLVHDKQTDLVLALGQLETADLIRQSQVEPDLEYMFKHALTQDVAYEGLLKGDRQKLHARTAHAMEEVYANRLPEFVEVLAYHYQRGGETDKAVHYLVESGKKCVERYALEEASRHYQQAYALLSDGGPTGSRNAALTDLLIAWSQVHYYLGTIKEWRALLEEHLDSARDNGDPSLVVIYLGWLGNARCFHGDFAAGSEALNEAYDLSLSENLPQALRIIVGWHSFALTETLHPGDAIKVLGQVAHGDDARSQARYSYVKAQAGLEFALMFHGDFAKCHAICNDLIELGRSTGNSRAEVMGHYFKALSSLFYLDFDQALRSANDGVSCARDPNFQVMTSAGLGMAHLINFDYRSALEICRTWQPAIEVNENRWFGFHMRMVSASGEMMSGQLSDGLRNYLALIEQGHKQGMMATVVMGETLLLFAYVSVARLDLKPSLSSLLKNPWFVFTQAPFAGRKAKKLANRLREEYGSLEYKGILDFVDWCEGRLLIHQRQPDEARQCLDRIRGRLREQGVDEDPSPVVALADEIGRFEK